MGTAETVGMAIFGLLIVGALVLAVRPGGVAQGAGFELRGAPRVECFDTGRCPAERSARGAGARGEVEAE
jgi:hypothetical protein